MYNLVDNLMFSPQEKFQIVDNVVLNSLLTHFPHLVVDNQLSRSVSNDNFFVTKQKIWRTVIQ